MYPLTETNPPTPQSRNSNLPLLLTDPLCGPLGVAVAGQLLLHMHRKVSSLSYGKVTTAGIWNW